MAPFNLAYDVYIGFNHYVQMYCVLPYFASMTHFLVYAEVA